MSVTAPADLVVRDEVGDRLSTLVWRFAEHVRCVSTAAVGGGLAEAAWLVNAQVPHGYHRVDLVAHADEITSALGLTGPGVLMLTAVDVGRRETASVEGVVVTATVGVSDPTFAADANATSDAARAVGTVNIVVQLPAAHSAAAMVNLVATVTEAKCQAFAAWPVPGTGTPSDAVSVVCPLEGVAEPFGGPRSRWGRPVAKAAYDAITAGLHRGFEPAC